MRISKNPAIIIFLLLVFSQANAQIPERSGWWKFDVASDLLKAEAGYGVDLMLSGTNSEAPGPSAENGAVLIGVGSYYKMQHQIAANGGGIKVNEYTLQYDFKISGNGVWHSFFQTDAGNSNDGDFFINPNGNIGVGAVGYSTYSVVPNEWYRMTISVRNGSMFNCYLDGQFLISGNVQAIDDRFSLGNQLLIFADENGEDANIYCSELAIWNQALSASQVSESGGFSHDVGSFLMTRIPYLHGQGTNTMTVCWHDIAQTGTKVKYGKDSDLTLEMPGTSEIVSDPYCWHTVKLKGLEPNTRYFYRVVSSAGESDIYSFKTLPDSAYTGKIRFLILGDTHASDTTMAGKVLRAARAKISELYGPDIENHVNGIFHSGDIVVNGDAPGQYTKQYFKPISALSSNIPTMVVAGNHEGESPYFYQYLKLDDQSAIPQTPALNEKVWQLRVGNALFIGMNTNITNQYGTIESNWLDTRLNVAETDTTLDFVFLFFHHPPFSELWYEVNTFDGGSDYVRDVLFPIVKKYSKVQQMHYGHTHGIERGTITSDKPDGDFRLICGGGGGGPLDPWVEGVNHDYNDIQVCISNYFFQILEIDIANHSYQNSAYSLGTLNKPKKSELIDTWHKSKNQSRPETPTIDNIESTDTYVLITSSKFSGIDSLMSVQYQLIDSSQNAGEVIDSTTHWKNIYGVDHNSIPVDHNQDLNLYQTKISLAELSNEKEYFFRVRYRDQNLKWSNWSDLARFKTLGKTENQSIRTGYIMNQNYPNPFQNNTAITYTIPEKSEVIFRIYDADSRQVAEINEGFRNAGTYQFDCKAETLSSGIYLYKMITSNQCVTKKMIITRPGR